MVITSYNLSLSLYMKEEFMFLTMLIPEPNNPKGKIDVFMQPLIEELKSFMVCGSSDV